MCPPTSTPPGHCFQGSELYFPHPGRRMGRKMQSGRAGRASWDTPNLQPLPVSPAPVHLHNSLHPTPILPPRAGTREIDRVAGRALASNEVDLGSIPSTPLTPPQHCQEQALKFIFSRVTLGVFHVCPTWGWGNSIEENVCLAYR